jgi:hypothetical protein
MKKVTMRAVRCHRFAALDTNGKPLSTPLPIRQVLQLDEVEMPKLRNDGVLVSTHFAGIQSELVIVAFIRRSSSFLCFFQAFSIQIFYKLKVSIK